MLVNIGASIIRQGFLKFGVHSSIDRNEVDTGPCMNGLAHQRAGSQF